MKQLTFYEACKMRLMSKMSPNVNFFLNHEKGNFKIPPNSFVVVEIQIWKSMMYKEIPTA